MKASSSTGTDDGEAENKSDEHIVFDYCDFFSVLMYYAHMSKEDILNHSRAFLHGIYRMYIKRASENLGVSPSGKEDDNEESEEDNKKHNFIRDYELDQSDYPTQFVKLPSKKGKALDSTPDKTRDFLKAFGGGAEVFKDVQIIKDS